MNEFSDTINRLAKDEQSHKAFFKLEKTEADINKVVAVFTSCIRLDMDFVVVGTGSEDKGDRFEMRAIVQYEFAPDIQDQGSTEQNKEGD